MYVMRLKEDWTTFKEGKTKRDKATKEVTTIQKATKVVKNSWLPQNQISLLLYSPYHALQILAPT